MRAVCPVRRGSDVEAEVADVAFVHDVLLAFEAPTAGVLRSLLATVGDEVVEGGHLGADEAALHVRVDLAGGLRRGLSPPSTP